MYTLVSYIYAYVHVRVYQSHITEIQHTCIVRAEPFDALLQKGYCRK